MKAQGTWQAGKHRRRFNLDYPLAVSYRQGRLEAHANGDERADLWVGHKEGCFFVQPNESAEAAPRLNDEPLQQPRWLKKGDILTLRDQAITIRQAEHAHLLLEAPTVPAKHRDPLAGSEIITPAAMKSPSQARLRRRLFWGLFFALILGSAGYGAYHWFYQPFPVTLSITPAPELIEINGVAQLYDPGTPLSLSPGTHQITAYAPGYESRSWELRASRTGPPPETVALQPLPGIVDILSQPAGAFVYLNDERIGSTPLSGYALPAGEYRLRLEQPNFIPATETITVAGARQREIIEIPMIRDWANIGIRTDPAGAQISINGQALGATPLTLQLKNGEYLLRATYPDRQPWETLIEVEPGVDKILPTFAFDWQDGQLDLSTTPNGVWVEVDGRVLGQAPGQFALRPFEEHRIVLSYPDHFAREFTLELEPGQSIQRSYELEPQTGRVRFESTPTRAEVRINGSLQGLTPLDLELPVREMTVNIRKAGFREVNRRLRPINGQEQVIEEELEFLQRAPDPTEEDFFRAAAVNLPSVFFAANGYEMALVVPGPFQMGSPEDAPGRQANENQVDVRLFRPFYVGVFEVTNRQLREFRPSHDSGVVFSYSLDAGDHPAVNVDWATAVRFCNWLSERENLPPAYVQNAAGDWEPVQPWPPSYRLPTEAEWEYIARSDGSRPTRVLAWGTVYPPEDNTTNMADSSATSILRQVISDYTDGYAATAPVGSFEPNPLGLHDLGGNVAEWTHDYYVPLVPNRIPPVIDPIGPEEGTQRVVRGSSWRGKTLSDARVTTRRFADDGADDIGFRIVKPVELQ